MIDNITISKMEETLDPSKNKVSGGMENIPDMKVEELFKAEKVEEEIILSEKNINSQVNTLHNNDNVTGQLFREENEPINNTGPNICSNLTNSVHKEVTLLQNATETKESNEIIDEVLNGSVIDEHNPILDCSPNDMVNKELTEDCHNLKKSNNDNTVTEQTNTKCPDKPLVETIEKDESFCLIQNLSSNTSLETGHLLFENEKLVSNNHEVHHAKETEHIENMPQISDNLLDFSMPSTETPPPSIKSDIRLGEYYFAFFSIHLFRYR